MRCLVKVGSSALLPAALASLPAAIAPKKAEATAASAAPAAKKQAEDGFDLDTLNWKAVAVRTVGFAGFAAGALLGEHVGMSLLRDLVPHISMTAFYALPLATTIGGALVGAALATSPFLKREG